LPKSSVIGPNKYSTTPCDSKALHHIGYITTYLGTPSIGSTQTITIWKDEKDLTFDLQFTDYMSIQTLDDIIRLVAKRGSSLDRIWVAQAQDIISYENAMGAMQCLWNDIKPEVGEELVIRISCPSRNQVTATQRVQSKKHPRQPFCRVNGTSADKWHGRPVVFT